MEVIDESENSTEREERIGEELRADINDDCYAQDNASYEVQAQNLQPCINLDTTDTESEQSCPICMEQWTSSGKHRLCCLRCGHLFGYSCILRWLQESCTSINRRCPQCNRKAAVKHIRMLYTKKLSSIDTAELDKLKTDLTNMTAERNSLQIQLSKFSIRQKVYEQQLTSMKNRVAELENQQCSQNSIQQNQNTSRLCNKKFHLERSIEMNKEGGCRVLGYNPWYKFLVASQQAKTTLFNGFGVKKIDCDTFDSRQLLFLHSQAIRDIKFHSVQQTLLLTVGFDKSAKLTDIRSNMIAHTYKTEYPLWSCAWSGGAPNIFLVGAQNGSITQFDIRNTSRCLNILDGSGDWSPVVSLATIPSCVSSGINKGGFIACRLNTCYVYEVEDSTYLSKQVLIDGPFVSVCYDETNNHILVSSRPNARQAYARHLVCTLEKDIEEAIICNVVHTFHAGNSQQLLSRPCHIYADNDTLVAAHQESTSSISLWSIASGKLLYGLPVSDPVMDLCSFITNNDLFLATLSTKKLRLYNYGHLG